MYCYYSLTYQQFKKTKSSFTLNKIIVWYWLIGTTLHTTIFTFDTFKCILSHGNGFAYFFHHCIIVGHYNVHNVTFKDACTIASS